MNNKGIGNCVHIVWVDNNAVFISNDDDGFYVTEFNSKKEVEDFIAKLNKAANVAFATKR